MAYTKDVSEDWAYWNNSESVTLNIRSDGTDGSDISVSGAYRMVDNNWVKNTFQGVSMMADQVMWLLPADQVGTSNEIDMDAKITDASANVFRALTVRRLGSGNSYSHWAVLCSEVE